jgi:hypothetical protein
MALSNCRKCGNVITDGAGFCPHCGHRPGGAGLRAQLLAISAISGLAAVIYVAWRMLG